MTQKVKGWTVIFSNSNSPLPGAVRYIGTIADVTRYLKAQAVRDDWDKELKESNVEYSKDDHTLSLMLSDGFTTCSYMAIPDDSVAIYEGKSEMPMTKINARKFNDCLNEFYTARSNGKSWKTFGYWLDNVMDARLECLNTKDKYGLYRKWLSEKE